MTGWEKQVGMAIRTALAVGMALGLWSCGPDEPPDLSRDRARYALEQGRWDWARVYLTDDLERHPDRAESLLDLATAWFSGHGGGLAKGVPFLEHYLEKKPDDIDARIRLVGTLIRLGRFDEAGRWAEGLGDHIDGRYLEALILAEDDSDQALEVVARVLEDQPGHVRANALAGRLLEATGAIDGAVKACRRALDADPFDVPTRVRLERLLRMAGHDQDAERERRLLDITRRLESSVDAAALSPSEEVALLQRMADLDVGEGEPIQRRRLEALMRSGRVEEALGLFDRLDGSGVLGIEGRLSLAKHLADSGREERARAVYESVLEQDPVNAPAVTSLGVLDLRAGNAAAAGQRMEAALAEDPRHARFHAVLAQARLSEGDEEGAVSHWETALELAPWEDRWRRRLVNLRRARGEDRRAEATLAAAPDATAPVVRVPAGGGAHPRSNETETTGAADGWWADVSLDVGLDFAQVDGRSGERFYVETTGSGAAFFDFDDDGDLDIYLLTGAATPGSTLDETPRNRLFENRNGRYVDITDQAGVGDETFSMGVCTGDADGDGRLDLMVANYGPDRLYRNLGSGRFEEIGAAAGVNDSRWSSNCAFADVDGDADLDLYVSHYLDADFQNNPFCGDRARGISAYCRPSVFNGVADSLFINSGDGTFVEEGARRGLIQGHEEKGFGVVFSDLDEDGDLDIFVANDSTPNRLYRNDGTGFFEEAGLISGLALSGEGRPTSGMGADIGDIDGDGRQDVVLTNYAMESNGIYRNLGGGVFEDACRTAGVFASSFPEVGWGARLADFDNDGDLDLAVANGHVIDNIELFEPDNTYAQPNRLFLNDGSGVFVDESDAAGAPWREARVSRALTVGDWNSDGRLDVLIGNANDRFQLLENRSETGHHWLGLDLIGPDGNRAAIGARVSASVGGRTMVREVRSGTGFQSQGDLRVHFGLGFAEGPVRVEIRWPDGIRQTETVDRIDRYVPIARDPGPGTEKEP